MFFKVRQQPRSIFVRCYIPQCGKYAEFQIGELAGHLSEAFKEKTKNEIPWKEIRGMRNIFAHNYLEMDAERIWEVAAEDIPALKKFCEAQVKSKF